MRLRIALLLALFGAIGCESGGEGSKLTCGQARLSSSTVDAGELVEITGLQPPQGFSLELSSGALDSPIEHPAFHDPETGVVRFAAPASAETMDRTTQYTVAAKTEEGDRCKVGTLQVGPLPQPGERTVQTVVDDLQRLMNTQRNQLGLTREQLLDPPEGQQYLLAPLAAAQYAIDHPDNPDSLRRIAEGRAESFSWAPQQRELVNRILAAYDPALLSLDGGGIEDCGTGVAEIDEPGELACWIGVHENVEQALGSQEAQYVRAAIGFVIAVATVFTEGTILPYVALANFAVSQIIEATIHLTPSTLDRLSVSLRPGNLCSQETGTIHDVELTAQNQGWTITALTIVDGVLSILGLPLGKAASSTTDIGTALSKVSQVRLEAKEAAGKVIDTIKDWLLSFAGFVANTGEILEIPKHTFGPVTLTPEWYQVEADEALSITGTSYAPASPLQLGPATLRVSVIPEKFHGLTKTQNELVEIREFRIDVHDVYAQPQENVQLVGSVHCSDNTDVFWTSMNRRGGEVIDHEAGTYIAPMCDRDPLICPYEEEVRANLVGADAPPDTFTGDVVVAGCCLPNPPTSCTFEERCACPEPPPWCSAPLAVSPDGQCVQPGTSLQMEVHSQLGDNAGTVQWELAADDGGPPGNIDDDGLYGAPSRETRVTVTARSGQDPDVRGQATVHVTEDCVRWVVHSALGTWSGDDVVVALAETTGEYGWPISFGQSDGTRSPTGTLSLAHPGRDDACTGPTGEFLAEFFAQKGAAEPPADEGVSLNSDGITAEVVRLDPGALSIRFSGRGEYERVGTDEEPVPTFIQGALYLAGSDCIDPGEASTGPDGGVEDPSDVSGDLLGRFYDPSSDSHTCQAVYATGAYSEDSWDMVCASDPRCQDDQDCPDESRIGRCDLRAQGSTTTIPMVEHYYEGNSSTVGELMEGCRVRGGNWIDG